MTDPAATQPPAPRAGAPRLVVLLSLAFGVLCLAAAAAFVLTERGEAEQQSVQQAAAVRLAATEAARQRTEALTSYDYRTLEDDTAGVLRTATGEFEQEYAETVQKLRDTFVQSEAVATSKVLAVGIEGEVAVADAGPRAVAVVAVDQVIDTAGAPPRTERNRLRMTLVRPADTWLVASVERL